jgi:hypothetical protein
MCWLLLEAAVTSYLATVAEAVVHCTCVCGTQRMAIDFGTAAADLEFSLFCTPHYHPTWFECQTVGITLVTSMRSWQVFKKEEIPPPSTGFRGAEHCDTAWSCMH